MTRLLSAASALGPCPRTRIFPHSLQSTRLLGVSKSTLRRMEGESLTPVVGPKNVRLFHEEQIHSMVVTRRAGISGGLASGELAAEAFQMFDDHVHPVDVVKKLRVEPTVIETLYERWSKMRAMLTLSRDVLAALNAALCDGESVPLPQTEAALLTLVNRWVRDISPLRCDRCRAHSAAFCRSCAKAWGVMAARNEIAARKSRLL